MKKYPTIIFGLVFIILSSMCIRNMSLADTYINIKNGEKVKDFEAGSLYKIKYKDKVKDVIVFNNGKTEDYSASKHGSYFKSSKISEPLEKLIKEDENQELTVAIWFKDIDQTAIEKEAKELLKIDDINKIDNKTLQKYIEVKRELAKVKYESLNKRYYDKYLPNEEVVFISNYAPLIIVNIKIYKILKLSEFDDILSFQLVEKDEKKEETSYSIPNINANYLRNNLNLRGSGIKVGIVEINYADKSNSQLNDRNIIFDVSDAVASQDTGSHATKVASIIVGRTQGIVPDATVYMTAAKNRLEDYEKIEWLMDQGVSVINYSAGYSTGAGLYSDMAKWIDHLSFQHNITFVKSSGNGGDNSYITDPGMAYNGITVSSINDNNSFNEPNWNDDSFSNYSSFLEIEGGYKPDLSAPGEDISVAGFLGSNGTSFSAAHVTGVIAQILQSSPDLIFKPCALNAILKAGTLHKTANDYNFYSMIPDYSNREGAGVIDAKGAYQSANASNYIQVQLDNGLFPYSYPITINYISSPVRIVLNWHKQNSILNNGSINLRNISDMDLYIIDPNGQIVAASTTANNNTEMVEFTPTVKGTYTVIVDGYILENTYEVFGLAWYQK